MDIATNYGWQNLEAKYGYLIRRYAAAAHKKWPSILASDIEQEVRLHLFRMRHKLEAIPDEKLGAYTHKVISNACVWYISRELQKNRIKIEDVVATYREDGTAEYETHYRSVLAKVQPMDERFSSVDERILSTKDDQIEKINIKNFLMALKAKLNEREIKVLDCKLNPSKELRSASKNGIITNVDIANHLMLTKGKVDWAICKIKYIFTELACLPQFKSLYEDEINSAMWPKLNYVVGKQYDENFVNQVIVNNNLDDENVLEEKYDSSEEYKRSIIKYEWGAVVILSNRYQCYTMVIQGKLNEYSGEVFGTLGTRIKLPANWYMQASQQFGNKIS